MTLFDIPRDAAHSCLRLGIDLSQTAQSDVRLVRAAELVHRYYRRALAPALTGHIRERRWQRFITALDTYLSYCPPSRTARELRRIVAENADLLLHEGAVSGGNASLNCDANVALRESHAVASPV